MAQLSRHSYITTVLLGNIGTAVGSDIVDGIATLSVDMSGYEGAYFVAGLTHGGTSSATANTFAVRQSTAAITIQTSGGQGTAITGASATLPTGSSATAEHVVIDVYKPRTGSGARFLFGQWTVASSCAALGAAYCIQYEPTNLGNSTQTNSTGVRVIPQTTASSTAVPFLTGGVTAVVSGATN